MITLIAPPGMGFFTGADGVRYDVVNGAVTLPYNVVCPALAAAFVVPTQLTSAALLAALAALDAPAVFGDTLVVADKGDFGAPLVLQTVRTADDYSIAMITADVPSGEVSGSYGLVLGTTLAFQSKETIAARVVDLYNNQDALTRGGYINSSLIYAVLDQEGPATDFAIGQTWVSSDGMHVGTINTKPLILEVGGAPSLTLGVDGGAVFGAGGVEYPSADPHIAGRWWDNAGTLTRSAG